MDQSEWSDDNETRLNNLINKITRVIYTNVSRGLFEAHKLIYSFLIAISIEKQENRLDNSLWNVYLRGAGVMDYS
jgi:dynein heavy chain